MARGSPPYPFGICGTIARQRRAEVAESCALADSGSWELSYNATRSWPAALSECALQCKRCANCQYISFSTRKRECRWFKACTLQQNLPAFRSLEVKDMRVVKDMQQQLESELLAAPGDQHHQHPHKGSSGGGGEGEATWLVVVTSASPFCPRACRGPAGWCKGGHSLWTRVTSATPLLSPHLSRGRATTRHQFCATQYHRVVATARRVDRSEEGATLGDKIRERKG